MPSLVNIQAIRRRSNLLHAIRERSLAMRMRVADGIAQVLQPSLPYQRGRGSRHKGLGPGGAVELTPQSLWKVRAARQASTQTAQRRASRSHLLTGTRQLVCVVALRSRKAL